MADDPQALGRLMVIEDQSALAPHQRSRARLRKAVKSHFDDPALAMAALGAAPERLLLDLERFGLLLESVVIRDLPVLSRPRDGQVFHDRDHDVLAVDAIVQLRDGRSGEIQIKLGKEQVEQAAVHLTRFAAEIDSDRFGEQDFLAVIRGKGSDYRRSVGGGRWERWGPSPGRSGLTESPLSIVLLRPTRWLWAIIILIEMF